MRLPLTVQIRPSRIAATALTVIHGLGVAALAVSQFSLVFKIALLTILALSLARSLQNHALRAGGRAILTMTLREGGEAVLTFRDGHYIAAKIDPSSTVLHWLMALRLRSGKKWMSVWLLPDMLDVESWRLLSTSLRAITADVK